MKRKADTLPPGTGGGDADASSTPKKKKGNEASSILIRRCLQCIEAQWTPPSTAHASFVGDTIAASCPHIDTVGVKVLNATDRTPTALEHRKLPKPKQNNTQISKNNRDNDMSKLNAASGGASSTPKMIDVAASASGGAAKSTTSSRATLSASSSSTTSVAPVISDKRFRTPNANVTTSASQLASGSTAVASSTPENNVKGTREGVMIDAAASGGAAKSTASSMATSSASSTTSSVAPVSSGKRIRTPNPKYASTSASPSSSLAAAVPVSKMSKLNSIAVRALVALASSSDDGGDDGSEGEKVNGVPDGLSIDNTARQSTLDSTGGEDTSGKNSTARSASSPAISEKNGSTKLADKSHRTVGAEASKLDIVAPPPLPAESSTEQLNSLITTSATTESSTAARTMDPTSSSAVISAVTTTAFAAQTTATTSVMVSANKPLPEHATYEMPLPAESSTEQLSGLITTSATTESSTVARTVDPTSSSAVISATTASAAQATATTSVMVSANEPLPEHATYEMPASEEPLLFIHSPSSFSTVSTSGPPNKQLDPHFSTTRYNVTAPNSNNIASALGYTTSSAAYCQNSEHSAPTQKVVVSDATKEDERKLPYQRPSPPGLYANWDGGRGGVHQQQSKGETLSEAGVLTSTILRAREILSSTAASSQRRREGQPKITVNACLASEDADLERVPVDPPMICSSSSIPCASTLQEFRNASSGGGSARTQPTAAAAATMAGEPAFAVEKRIESKPRISANLEPSSSTTTHPSLSQTTCLSVGKLLLVLQVGMGILYLLANTYSNPRILSPDHISSSEDHVSCFINHPHTMHDVYSDSEYFTHQCEGGREPCPQWGRCHEGKLLDCTDERGIFEGWHRFVPNVRRDQCIPSPEANEFITIVNEVLLQMTSDLICQSGWTDDDTAFPLFSLDSVVEKVKEASANETISAAMSSELLRWLSPVFDSSLVRFGSLSGENGSKYSNAVGLGQVVPLKSLPLPFSCRLNLLLWELMGYLFHSFSGLVWFLIKILFRIAASYPLCSIGALALWQLMQYFKRRRKHRAKVLELHGIVLEAVYDRLSERDDHEGYAALILRDDIGHELYPSNFSQRLFLNGYVWRRVALEIHADNRVRKFRKLSNGKKLEHWDFAMQSRRGRRLRKSIVVGTSGSNCVDSEALQPNRDP